MNYNKLLKKKRFHRLEALRTALIFQLRRDREEFEKTKVMRCWDCLNFMEEELKKVKEKQKQMEVTRK